MPPFSFHFFPPDTFYFNILFYIFCIILFSFSADVNIIFDFYSFFLHYGWIILYNTAIIVARQMLVCL
ncbi:hypothetical protein ROSINTL182_08826 [Roseburia intestinalis L1-82]|uniref:Uncharacterized protein n=1 Tax=Roseburia intestinalis L1-82 TaxID=536231 RepID=C7GFW8_9FIRM|nr:hypothetical protein ROSINTL182_08826 [Roseburia intestinalis L1-82]